MYRNMTRLTTLVVLAALVLTLCCGAFAAQTDASFTLRSINSDGNAMGGASFSLVNSNGSSVAAATTGSNGYVLMTIPASALADEGTTNFTLVQTKAPAGYEATDNNWKVAVTVEGSNASVSIAANGLWDTILDWVPGTVITGSEFKSNTLTVANLAQYYEIPTCSKVVKGLSASQMKGYTSDYELKSSAGTVVATGHAVGFAEQNDGSYKASIAFDTKKLPADTYTLTEKSVSSVSGMDLKSTTTVHSGKVTIGSASFGDTVTATYAAPVVATPDKEVANHGTNTNKTNVKNDNGKVDEDKNDDAEVTESPNADPEASDKADVEIEDEQTPTAANPTSAHSYVWYIVLAVVVIAAAVFFLLRKKKANAQ